MTGYASEVDIVDDVLPVAILGVPLGWILVVGALVVVVAAAAIVGAVVATAKRS